MLWHGLLRASRGGIGLHRYLMPRTHLVAPACAALFLAAAAHSTSSGRRPEFPAAAGKHRGLPAGAGAAGGGGAAHAFINAGCHVGPGSAPGACGDWRDAPASSRSQLGDRRAGSGARAEGALHGCVGTAVGADRVAPALYKKKIKKKAETFRGAGIPLPVRAMRIPFLDVDPQKVSPQAHPAILLLRAVVLLV